MYAFIHWLSTYITLPQLFGLHFLILMIRYAMKIYAFEINLYVTANIGIKLVWEGQFLTAPARHGNFAHTWRTPLNLSGLPASTRKSSSFGWINFSWMLGTAQYGRRGFPFDSAFRADGEVQLLRNASMSGQVCSLPDMVLSFDRVHPSSLGAMDY